MQCVLLPRGCIHGSEGARTHRCLSFTIWDVSVQIQLSAYPNHIGDNIKDLDTFMTTHLAGNLAL